MEGRFGNLGEWWNLANQDWKVDLLVAAATVATCPLATPAFPPKPPLRMVWCDHMALPTGAFWGNGYHQED